MIDRLPEPVLQRALTPLVRRGHLETFLPSERSLVFGDGTGPRVRRQETVPLTRDCIAEREAALRQREAAAQ